MVIGQKRGSNLKGFEKSLDIDFGRYPPETKRELSILMRNLKYHVKKGEKEFPTDKQLNHAWNYLKRNYISEQKTIDYYFRVESYKGRTVYRATQEKTISGKKYRKGQFLPKKK